MDVNYILRFYVFLWFGIRFKTSLFAAGSKPCTWTDGDRQIGGIDGCRYRKAMGKNVLIDFRSAAKFLVPSCTCHIQVVDDGFIAFHVQHVPEDDDCKSMVCLGSSERKTYTKYECGKKHPTRLLSLDDRTTITLSVNKTGIVKEASDTAFCFRISSNVELYVKCFPDAFYTSVTPADVEPTKNPGPPVMNITEAIPATLGGVAFILVLMISILCLVRRQRRREKSNGSTSSTEIMGTDSEYSGISTIRGSESIRSYDDIMPGDYLRLRDPNRIAIPISDNKQIHVSAENMSRGNRDKYSHHVSEDTCTNQTNQFGPLSVPRHEGITSDYETSGYYDDDEHPYDVISDDLHVYENSNEHVQNGCDNETRDRNES